MWKKYVIIGVFLFGLIILPLMVGAAESTGTGIQIPENTGLSEDTFVKF